MAQRSRNAVTVLLQALASDRAARLAPCDQGFELLADAWPGRVKVSSKAVRQLVARGLLAEAEPGHYVATRSTAAWLRRQASGDLGFRAQHDHIEPQEPSSRAPEVLVNLDESPVATLARRAGKSGAPWLAPHQATAADRLRRDFELAQLRPRVTANWSASVNLGRRSSSGPADLTDMAVAARLRFNGAIEAVGPEFAGVLIDVCCFLKGLETVERERQWPARSAKLVLRMGLERLARQYGLTTDVAGCGRRLRQWGADDYRPEIS
jgi:hypothetical protein